MQGDTQIGQTVHWQVVTSAIGPPGQIVTSHIKYGRGIWKEMELKYIYWYFKKALPKRWCNLIIQEGESRKSSKGTIGGGGKKKLKLTCKNISYFN